MTDTDKIIEELKVETEKSKELQEETRGKNEKTGDEICETRGRLQKNEISKSQNQ